ncbi:MAG: TIGR04211 family SH3 domain-containing protein [Desulfocapsaceae bacterium]|nr:TIGR04211 family SH3 domain-containing protein [Desulfocapsaceae bacterium]
MFARFLSSCCSSALVFCGIIILWSNTVQAQTWYVKPTAEIPLRRGQGSDYKILAIVSDGAPVTVVEENETWAKITTTDGKEGWILKRYLTQQTPLDRVVTNLRAKNQTLEQQLTETRTENEELQRVQQALENTLANHKEELATLADEHNTLVEDTANVITIKSNLEESREAVTDLQQKIGVVVAENNRLKASQNIRWFLAGGGTLILGCIIGMIISRSKKKKSSLY